MNRTTPPPTYPTALKKMPQQSVKYLKNGICFHYFSGGDQPVCRLSIVFQGGASELGNDAISRIMLNALADGTKSFAPESLADKLDYNGIRVSGSCHGHYSSLTFNVLNERLEALLLLVGSMLSEPIFPEERLKSRLLSAKAQFETSLKEVSTIANESFDRLVMGAGHPLAQVLQPKWFDGVTSGDIATVYRRMLCPAKMHIFLSGQLNSIIISKVRSFGESIPCFGDSYDLQITAFSPAEAGSVVRVSHPESMQSSVAMGIPSIPRIHPDYIPLRLSIMALGGYFGSRLMANIREEKGLTYGISAALIGSQEGAYLKIMAQCDKSYTGMVISEIRKEALSLADNPPAGAELERLKFAATTSLVETLDTPTSVMSYYATRLFVGMPDNYFEAQQLAIQALDADTIAEMAQKYLNPDSFVTAIAGG